MKTEVQATAREAFKVPLPKFVGYFLWLGAAGFGGPIALAGHMQQDLESSRADSDRLRGGGRTALACGVTRPQRGEELQSAAQTGVKSRT